ncbi:polysaccharide pyruvyl transferase family protein [Cohnella sp. AR92]|uniref:polysaccharide pyruvyl transferase family protein n=1 Tax=Cohnella sp. AR92 TaxID=648716 RepID=UPI000F8E5D2C|nr:polysaccharide pyruvyl transferase family protein [Cohnella sp. AR92]RUS46783.1 polysaccharide pyruvyl transferase family protein [Cohnella sp. AR92]
MKRKVLYLGWIGFKNFGDEFMWTLFRELADRYLPSDRYEIIPSVPGVDVKDLSGYDTVVLGGGSLLIGGYADLAHQAAKEGKRLIVWGSGYDCIHLSKAERRGVVRPESVRESDGYRSKLADIAGHASFFGVRGPWTLAYLREQGVPLDRIRVSGDPGLLVAAPEKASSVDSAGGEGSLEATQDRWIGINWGTVYNRIYGADEAALEDSLASVCRTLIARGFKLYLYVVWGPDREASRRLFGKISSEKVVYDPDVHEYPEYIRMMERLELTVNLKLHACVLSAAVGVPFVSLGYRFKCFDFASSLGAEEMIVPTDEADAETAILRAIDAGLSRKRELAASFAEAKGRAETLLREPFERGLF